MSKKKYEYDLKMFLESNDPFDYYTFIEVFNDFLDHINYLIYQLLFFVYHYDYYS